VDSAQYLTLQPFRFTDLPAEIRLQIHELCLVSPTPLRLSLYEDGWHDPHAEPAPILSLLLVKAWHVCMRQALDCSKLARHSHTSYKHISWREVFQHRPCVKCFFVDLEASPNLPTARMRAWTSVAQMLNKVAEEQLADKDPSWFLSYNGSLYVVKWPCIICAPWKT